MEVLASPIKFTTGLIIAFAIFVAYTLFRRRSDFNLPLVLYVALMFYMSWTDQVLNPYVVYMGLIFALVLRFEYMNVFLTKTFCYAEIFAIVLIVWNLLGALFGQQFSIYW